MNVGVTGPHAFGDVSSVANRAVLGSCIRVPHSYASSGGGAQNKANGKCVPNTTLAQPPTRLFAAQVVVWTPIATRLFLVRVWTLVAIIAGLLAA